VKCPVKISKINLPPPSSSKSRIVISGMIEDWSTSSKFGLKSDQKTIILATLTPAFKFLFQCKKFIKFLFLVVSVTNYPYKSQFFAETYFKGPKLLFLPLKCAFLTALKNSTGQKNMTI
jgi:hypothetical protein